MADNNINNNLNNTDSDNNIPAVNNTVSYKGMGRGSNPNSIKQLDPVRSKEIARERGRKGGLKSGEVRRNRKTMKDTILDLIQKEVSTEQYGGDSSILGDKATLQEIILASMIREASNGDTKAMQLLRDTIGEQPVNRQEITQEVITKDDTELMDSLKKSLIS